jgi:hypothetical protein
MACVLIRVKVEHYGATVEAQHCCASNVSTIRCVAIPSAALRKRGSLRTVFAR